MSNVHKVACQAFELATQAEESSCAVVDKLEEKEEALDEAREAKADAQAVKKIAEQLKEITAP